LHEVVITFSIYMFSLYTLNSDSIRLILGSTFNCALKHSKVSASEIRADLKANALIRMILFYWSDLKTNVLIQRAFIWPYS
jgi:hypothetical protein